MHGLDFRRGRGTLSAIAGVYDRLGDSSFLSEQARGMMHELSKYPADDTGVWVGPNVFLGCRAQWITPQSVSESLPYYDGERRLAITADAILDNRAELFEKLQIHPTYTKEMTDSQLILLAYRRWGEEAPKQLVGDFAFMIWDETKQQLFGARDFSGARTLYFHQGDHTFSFCTTIRPLLAQLATGRTLNEQWVAEFLAIHVTADTVDPYATVYQGIHQLPPSHSVTVADGKVRFTQYCTLMQETKLKLKSNAEYEEAFRDVFKHAVDARMRTHRQVGANLSGGLDSGSVASLAARKLKEENKRLQTFSYVPVDGFDGRPSRGRFADERPYIQSTVSHVGNIEDHYFSFPDKSPLTETDEWLELYEMPYKFFENTFWIRGIYEEAHKRDVGVLLSGQRGNWSVSWGPAIDYYGLLMKRWRWLRLYQEVNLYSQHMSTGRKRLYSRITKKAFPMLRHLDRSAQEQVPYLISSEFAQRTDVLERVQAHGFNRTDFTYQSAYAVRDHQFLNPNVWNLTGTVNTKLSLQYSLWGRDATNDLSVIRFCLSVPDEQFVKDGYDRALIRRSMESYLPDNVRLNMKTRGVQGADGVHRMAASWPALMDELGRLVQDPLMKVYLNIPELKQAMDRYRGEPRAETIFEYPFRLLMRALIFYRFVQKY